MSKVEKTVDVAADKSSSIHSWPKFPKTKINLMRREVYISNNGGFRKEIENEN